LPEVEPVTLAPPYRAEQAPATPLSVLVVDDSAVQRRFARTAIDADPTLTVVAEARNGREAVALVEELGPDAVLMDLHMPCMDGIQAIERIMATRPTPILVYSSFVSDEERTNAAAALAAGAVDVLAKPSAGESGQLEEYAEALRRQVRLVGRVRVITHPRGRLNGSGASLSGAAVVPPRPRVAQPSPAEPAGPIPTSTGGPVRLVAIGASTGGPHALATVLGALPADLDAAVVVVQHMAEGFIEGLADWLGTMCRLPVSVGMSGRRLQPGTVTVAPSKTNLIVHEQLRVTLQQPPATQYHVPGVDETFVSVADSVGASAIGVLLTGMGRDGAVGLKRMRDRGAMTIAQDEETSAVYGMPAAAAAIGAAHLQLPLAEIGPRLHELLIRSSAGAR
jgi:two-component system chemotaxis response regulator CheB